jgi:hypothetical protein
MEIAEARVAIETTVDHAEIAQAEIAQAEAEMVGATAHGMAPEEIVLPEVGPMVIARAVTDHVAQDPMPYRSDQGPSVCDRVAPIALLCLTRCQLNTAQSQSKSFVAEFLPFVKQ